MSKTIIALDFSNKEQVLEFLKQFMFNIDIIL